MLKHQLSGSYLSCLYMCCKHSALLHIKLNSHVMLGETSPSKGSHLKHGYQN
uniref:Uncharacterized protein n=1 Tax=Arundo donax TaxID=35708 RepID=A0A0A9GQ12_ARUDO